MDHNQQIYDGGSDEGEILSTLGLKRRQVALLETFRCCPYITQMAALFIPDEKRRAAYLQQTKITVYKSQRCSSADVGSKEEQEADDLLDAL